MTGRPFSLSNGIQCHCYYFFCVYFSYFFPFLNAFPIAKNMSIRDEVKRALSLCVCCYANTSPFILIDIADNIVVFSMNYAQMHARIGHRLTLISICFCGLVDGVALTENAAVQFPAWEIFHSSATFSSLLSIDISVCYISRIHAMQRCVLFLFTCYW